MSEKIVILVDGEVLADPRGSTIKEQKESAAKFASKLKPLLTSDLKIAIMHGNKPQVGYVLFRSEIASHILHPIPLDVCGADTQGATGYMLSQSIRNQLRLQNNHRPVMAIITQTVVNSDGKYLQEYNKQIGPWLDRTRAEQRRQVYGWEIKEVPGYGYRRVVSSPPPIDIVEIEGIRNLVESNMIVIASGGGGVPVVIESDNTLEGVEAVVDTDQVATILANEIEAKILLEIIRDDKDLASIGMSTTEYQYLTQQELEEILKRKDNFSDYIRRKLCSANRFIEGGGEQVIITTLDNFDLSMQRRSGIWIESNGPSIDISKYYS